jgi:ABC-type lipoprotein export system ATPase subunit
MLKLVNVSKYYSSEGNVALGLRNVNIEFKLNEIVAVVGESGSGKTTLLNVISGIDSYEEGEMYFNDNETSYYSISDWEDYRKNNVGFIFQNYNLIDSYNVLQNVETVLLLQGKDKKEAKEKALQIIERVGLSHRKRTKASKLSGGEKQRTVIARAIASEAKILVCDEPTGNLDSQSGNQIMELIKEVASNRLVIIVTHDYKLVEPYATRKVRLFDGEIVEDVTLKPTLEEVIVSEPTVTNKTTPLTYFYLAFKNILSTPKRSIFSLLVYIAITALIVGLYNSVFLTSNIQYNDNFGSGAYRFASANRIVVNKKDYSVFTPQEINKLKDISGVEHVYTNDYFLDLAISGYFDYDKDIYYYNAFYQSIDVLSSSDIIYGRMPENDNEVVFYYFKDETLLKPDFFIDKEIKIRYTNFKIVGITNKTTHAQRSNSIVYGSLFVENEMKILTYTNTTSVNIVKKANSDIKYEVNGITIINDSIEDDVVEVVYNKYYDTDNVVLSSDDYELQITQLFTPLTVTNYDVRFVETTASNGLYIRTNKKTLLKLIDSNVYQVTVMAKDSYIFDNVKNTIKNMDYRTIGFDFRSSGIDGLTLVLDTIVRTFVTVISLVALYFVSYMILSIIVNSKKKDYAILRILGANKSNLNLIVIFENLIMAVSAYILTIIITVIVNNYYKLNVLKIIEYRQYGTMLILLLIISFLAFLISLRFNRKLFSTTVNSSLR